MVGASLRGMPASCYHCINDWSQFPVCTTSLTFSSAKVKPRPARTRRLYLMPGQRTTGRSLSVGLGATFAAFSWRAVLRLFFLPGYEIRCQIMIWGGFALQAPLLSVW